jgi:hypothetical protein
MSWSARLAGNRSCMRLAALDRHDEADSRLCFISSTYSTTLSGLGNPIGTERATPEPDPSMT